MSRPYVVPSLLSEMPSVAEAGAAEAKASTNARINVAITLRILFTAFTLATRALLVDRYFFEA